MKKASAYDRALNELKKAVPNKSKLTFPEYDKIRTRIQRKYAMEILMEKTRQNTS